MAIDILKSGDRDLTLFRGRGRLEIREILESIVSFYKTGPTKNVLWDIREASIGHLGVNDILMIRDSLVVRSMQREGGRTAVVTSGKLDFGVARMGEGYVQDIPLEFMMFQEIEAAESWLDKKPAGK